MNKDATTYQLRKKAAELQLNYNTVLSKFFFDEFLKVLSLSDYKSNFMLKGGMLLTYALGIENRATHDVDLLVNGVQIEYQHIREVLENIVNNSDKTGVWFELVEQWEKIRPEDMYGGLRFHLVGHLSNIRIPFAVDIATGDLVYPIPEVDNYTTILGDIIRLKLYPLTSVLAEKLQTILARAELNTRNKDFYDIYAILNNKLQELDLEALRQAVDLTFRYRNTSMSRQEAEAILQRIATSQAVNDRWQRYQKKNPYASGVVFKEVICKIDELIGYALS